MTKRNLTQIFFPEIIILLLLLMYLTACSKKDQNNYTNPIFQIDLADTTYHHLLHMNGYFVVDGYSIVIANSGNGYDAADAICPACGAKQIQFNYSNFYYGFLSPWYCQNCGVAWAVDGSGGYPTGKTLKTYIVNQSGNIITVYL
jgi:hypothetical protein